MAVPGVALLLAVTCVVAFPFPECLDLLKPLALDDHSSMNGRWFFIMGASDNSSVQDGLETVMGSWVELTPTADRKVTLRWASKADDGECVKESSQASISGSPSSPTIEFTTGLVEHRGQLLQTDPDCLLWTDTTRHGEQISTGTQLLMLRRKAILEPPHLQTFRKQADCLNLPETHHHTYSGVTELCAEDTETPDCQDLLTPPVTKDHSPIYGKWYLIIGASDNQLFQTSLIPVKSSWVDIRPTKDTTKLVLRWGEWVDGTCHYGSTMVTISYMALEFSSYSTRRKGYYRQPCPDCLLWIDRIIDSDQTGQNLDMYRRIPKLESSHLKMFQKHADCLSFPAAYHSYDGVTEICSDHWDDAVCDSLHRPQDLEGLSRVYGKWFYVIGAADKKDFQSSLASIKSSWIDVFPSSDSAQLTLRWGERSDGKCNHGSMSAVIRGQGSSDASIEFNGTSQACYHRGTFLQPCPECLLWTDTTYNCGVTSRQLLLFRRTAKLDTSHLEVFRKHAACLTFPQTYHSYDGVSELCPDRSPK